MKGNDSLSQRVVHGGFWIFTLRITEKIFNLLRLVILARILAPHDFGLLGIALVTMSALETFSKTGFQEALIQKKEDIKSYLDAAWTGLSLRGFILFAILYLISPYVATFFDAPAAEPIIQVIGLSILLQAFTNIGVIYFFKEIEFRKQFIYQLSGIMVDFIVAVTAAFLLKNVWALVFGLLAGNAVRFFMSYIIHTYRPRLCFDLEKLRELFGFGKWVLGSSVLTFLITQGDDIFVGKMLGVAVLGFYQMAYKISNIPTTEIAHVISQVTFPAYSKIQDDLPRLREAYVKVLKLTAFLSFPIAGLILVLAPDFTAIFLGEKWMPMVPEMQVLALAGLVRSITATSGTIFYAVGKPKIDTKWQILRLIVIVALIYPFTARLGILGTSIVVFLSIFISNIGFSLDAIKIIEYNIKDFIKEISFPLMNGSITVLVIMGLKMVLSADIAGFIIFIITGFLTYFITTYLSGTFFNYKIKAVLKESFQLFRN